MLFDPTELITFAETFINWLFTSVQSIFDGIAEMILVIPQSINAIVVYINANSGVITLINNGFNAIPLIYRTVIILFMVLGIVFGVRRAL